MDVRNYKNYKIALTHSKLTTTSISPYLRAGVSKYRPEVYKSEKSKILKKIHKVALGKLLTQM